MSLEDGTCSGQCGLVGRGVPLVTDIVEVDCLAIDSHCHFRSLPLLGPLLLAPDIADHVCVAVSLTVQRSRETCEHIWLLDIECGSHFGWTYNSVSGHSLGEGVDGSRCFFSIQKKIGRRRQGLLLSAYRSLGRGAMCMTYPCFRFSVETSFHSIGTCRAYIKASGSQKKPWLLATEFQDKTS